MRSRVAMIASVLTLAVVSTAKANLLLNGGLESIVAPTQPDNLVYMTETSNTGALGPGWAITSGAVDVVPNSYFQSSQGGYSVDLAGSPGVGVLSQTVTTVVGDNYQLTFDYTINPENLTLEASSTKNLKITATTPNRGGGTTTLNTQTYVYPFAIPTLTTMHYVTGATFLFTATSTSTTISLTALLSNLPTGKTSATAYCGPVIDNFDLVSLGSSEPPIPEPASLATLGAGSLLLLRRRRRASRERSA